MTTLREPCLSTGVTELRRKALRVGDEKPIRKTIGQVTPDRTLQRSGSLLTYKHLVGRGRLTLQRKLVSSLEGTQKIRAPKNGLGIGVRSERLTHSNGYIHLPI